MRSQPAHRRLPQVDLLALWQRARLLARRRCMRTLWRLRRGEGGFYQTDDFMQDLYLEFAALVREWRADPDASERALWETWRRLLSHGGIRVLRRRPQRLWRAAHSSGGLTSTLQKHRDEQDLAQRRPPPTSPNPEPYIQPEDSEATCEQLARLDDLENALWALRPLQRQVIYMVAMADLPAAQVARLLGIDSPNAVYARLRTARTALRRGLRHLAHQRLSRDPPVA
jgi:RNA polymerase sigma factor (sigma-70 family)